MGLPAIAPYSMPGTSDLPKNKVSWTPDAKRAVLLIHDMQNYFVGAFTAGQSPVNELVANIQRLRKHCTSLGIPVVFSAQPGGQTPAQRGLQLDMWGAGINGGPEQKRIIDALEPAPGDIHLTKWRYSAFHNTALMDVLREQGRDQLLITGIYAHIGCLQTATHAFMSDVQAFMVADALGDFSREQHEFALHYAAKLCGVTATTDGVIELLGPAPLTAAASLSPERVREDVAELLEQTAADLREDENLLERGMDSIRIMSLVERWRRTGAEVSFVELAEKPTLADWCALLTPNARAATTVAMR
ncbi:isochorismatase family protein [Archangium primigenium]|uniref:isochorismatase family protein n=1 Tax=[Archangium] primigenium TaxID=2792470 RepID=UPI00195CF894|nr:isochorismatase family protein [Archangium primigenium]MBM7114616.1 isochorismatase family protein [Archangium primigenium]